MNVALRVTRLNKKDGRARMNKKLVISFPFLSFRLDFCAAAVRLFRELSRWSE